MKYIFDQFTLDCDKRELSGELGPIKVEPQVFALLELLLSRPDSIVTKDEINAYVWKGRIVSEAAVNSRIRSARLAIGDNGREQKYIKTVHGIGFRFIGDVAIKMRQEMGSDGIPTSSKSSKHIVSPSLKTTVVKTRKWQIPAFVMGTFALISLLYIGASFLPLAKNNLSEPSVSAKPFDRLPSIGVLPFVDMSEAGDQTYLGEGIAEEILNVLANVEGLKVASRTSAFIFRDNDTSIKTIGNALNVNHILEGSVRKFENTIRVTTQLIEVDTDSHVWSDTYDISISAAGLLKAQDEIANNVVRELGERLDFVASPALPQSNEAYDAYLKASRLKHFRSAKTLDEALRQYSLAIDLDPNFAKAYAGRAQIYNLRAEYSDQASSEVIQLMRNDIGAAASIAPDLPEVLFAAAQLAEFESRHQDVLNITRHIKAKHPNFAPAYLLRGQTLLTLDRLEEAEIEFEAGLTFDPLSPFMLNLLADVKFRLNDLKGAEETAEANYLWNPGNSQAMDMIGYLALNRGDYADAHAIYQNAIRLNPEDTFARDTLIMIYAELGLKEEALKMGTTPRSLAFALALTGEAEQALAIMKSTKEGMTDGETLFMAGEFELAAIGMERQVADEGLLGSNPIRPANADLYIEACYLYRMLGKAEADILCQKVEDFFEDKTPQNIAHTSDVIAGAFWHIANDDLEKAIKWIKTLTDKGLTDMSLTHHPAFKKLETHPNFPELYEAMSKNADKHKALILPTL
jgi:TolB-like protein/DNA-binding winged helix-turn-helix (wHTH) protein/Flp pilus assembly protein TadD